MGRLNSLSLSSLAFCLLVPAQAASARSGSLKPLEATISKNDAGFHECKTAAVNEWRDQGGSKGKDRNKNQLRANLATCRELYPTSVDFLGCKRAALQKFRKDRNSLKAALAECKNNLKTQTFDGLAALPFWLDDNQRVYFGGVGLNTPLPWDLAGIPHYTCEPLQAAQQNPEQREYFLFGNAPQTFAAFAKLDTRRILGLLGNTTSRKKTQHIDLRDFGRAFRDGKNQHLVFFPSSHCAYASTLRPNYLNVKIYYLLDQGGQRLVPYFGVAFLDPEAQTENINTYADLVASKLGSGYNPALSPDGKYMIISKTPIRAWDAEGDPKNVCANPRPNQWLAVLKITGEAKDKAEYLLLASVKNLCDYGDRLAGRLQQEF